MRISDWSSDVCSSDLYCVGPPVKPRVHRRDGLTARGCPQHPAAAAIWSRWSGRGLVDRGRMHGGGLLAISGPARSKMSHLKGWSTLILTTASIMACFTFFLKTARNRKNLVRDKGYDLRVDLAV